MGCCAHSDFKELCEIQCKPDCTSDAAQKCIKDCPVLCMEPDYAPAGCADKCREGECHENARCITSHAQNMTASGKTDEICDERKLQKAFKDYLTCEEEHPHRNPFQRLNAAVYCACSTGLGKAAKESKCCEARDWGEAICSMDADA